MRFHHLIFCYGSLKKGMARAPYLQYQRYLGVASTTPDYAMFQLSGHPALVNKTHPEAETLLKNPRPIFGELYEVDNACLAELDKVEGTADGLYERKNVDLAEVWPSLLPLNQEVFAALQQKRAEGYFYRKAIGGAKDCGSFWSPR